MIERMAFEAERAEGARQSALFASRIKEVEGLPLLDCTAALLAAFPNEIQRQMTPEENSKNGDYHLARRGVRSTSV